MHGRCPACRLLRCRKGKRVRGRVATVLPSESNEVTVKVLKRATFEHELVSNGKVTAGAMADLRFETTGVVAHIYVKNGDPVRKGQKLAELDKFRLKNKTAQAKDALDKAELELQDVLIGQGYPVGDTSKIPADIMKLARVKSGYDQSLSQYELAAYEEEHATLVAPSTAWWRTSFPSPSTRQALRNLSAPSLALRAWKWTLRYWKVNSPDKEWRQGDCHPLLGCRFQTRGPHHPNQSSGR